MEPFMKAVFNFFSLRWKMSDLCSGIRIRLDLSSVESCSNRQFRWAYLPYSDFSTVKDLKNHVRNQCLGDTKQKIRLFLQEPFWLPASENIRILQNGDLVKVKTRSDPENVEPVKTNQVTSDPAVPLLVDAKIQSNSAARKILKKRQTSPSCSESSNDDSDICRVKGAPAKIQDTKTGTLDIQLTGT
jgi:hypothetical protein